MFLSLMYSFYNIPFGVITLIHDKTKMLSEVNVERALFILLSLISANQLTGFYMVGTLAVKGLTHFSPVSHFYIP